MIEILQYVFNFIAHVDVHLVQLLAEYGLWIYAILFIIIFSETGLVVTPWLPGDSLLFAAGALTAIDTSKTLNLPLVTTLLTFAAILGNSCNYAIGKEIGLRAFNGRYWFLNLTYLQRTEKYFARYGGSIVIISRFMPIIRTFAPFVAGVGRMQYARFQFFNVFGALLWVGVFVVGGYIFGNISLIKNNFGIVTIVIILISILPAGLMLLRRQ